jgi:pilus assembly protein Flp/PilA
MATEILTGRDERNPPPPAPCLHVRKCKRLNRSQRKRKESQMIQLLAARLQLAKMRAEEGQALVEYALIVSLIAVVCIAALTATGTSMSDLLNKIANDV